MGAHFTLGLLVADCEGTKVPHAEVKCKELRNNENDDDQGESPIVSEQDHDGTEGCYS